MVPIPSADGRPILGLWLLRSKVSVPRRTVICLPAYAVEPDRKAIVGEAYS